MWNMSIIGLWVNYYSYKPAFDFKTIHKFYFLTTYKSYNISLYKQIYYEYLMNYMLSYKS